MNVIRLVIVSLSLVFLAACSGGGGLLSKSKGDPRSVDVAGLGGLSVSSWTVSVPPTLSVSEENSIKPRADIVWHGDPAGPRRQQVAAIFEAALARVAGQSTGAQTVALQVEVIQFHALTPKLRYFAEGREDSLAMSVVAADGSIYVAHSPLRRAVGKAMYSDLTKEVIGGIARFKPIRLDLLARDAICAAEARAINASRTAPPAS